MHLEFMNIICAGSLISICSSRRACYRVTNCGPVRRPGIKFEMVFDGMRIYTGYLENMLFLGVAYTLVFFLIF